MATANKPDALAELRNKHIPKAPFNVTTAFIREARGAVMTDGLKQVPGFRTHFA